MLTLMIQIYARKMGEIFLRVAHVFLFVLFILWLLGGGHH